MYLESITIELESVIPVLKRGLYGQNYGSFHKNPGKVGEDRAINI